MIFTSWKMTVSVAYLDIQLIPFAHKLNLVQNAVNSQSNELLLIANEVFKLFAV